MNVRRLLRFATVALLAGLFVGTMWLGATALFKSLSDLPTPLVSTIIVAVGGAIAWLTNRITTRLDAIASAHRDKKIEIYSKFSNEILKLFTPTQFRPSGGEENEPDLAQAMVTFQREVLFWGSPKVIKAYLETRSHANDARKMAIVLDRLFAAMRSDIGLSNWGLGQADLMKLMIRDGAEYDEWIAGKPIEPS